MNRELLKWGILHMDYSSVKENKVITVEMDKYPDRLGQGTVQTLREGPDGFSEFKTHQDNPFEYLSRSKEFASGEYELVIKE